MAQYNVLFLCIGNACRSQMAEGFARTYGKDILRCESAGLAPAYQVPQDTRVVMGEKGIDMTASHPKAMIDLQDFKPDVIVNMSGQPFSAEGVEVLHWKVFDPYMCPLDQYRKTRDDIEHRVMSLILTLRKRAASSRPSNAPLR